MVLLPLMILNLCTYKYYEGDLAKRVSIIRERNQPTQNFAWCQSLHLSGQPVTGVKLNLEFRRKCFKESLIRKINNSLGESRIPPVQKVPWSKLVSQTFELRISGAPEGWTTDFSKEGNISSSRLEVCMLS
jgi:hypothetical protein